MFLRGDPNAHFVCQSKLKSGTSVKSNKHDSMVMFTFPFSTGATLFWQIWSQNSKLETYLVARLT